MKHLALIPLCIINQIEEKIVDHPVGGWGINLIRSLTDEIKYDYEDNKNKLTLIKRKRSHPKGLILWENPERIRISYIHEFECVVVEDVHILEMVLEG